MSANPNATWTELILMTQSVIQELGLTYEDGTGLPSGQVYTFKFPTDGYRIPLEATGQIIQFPNVQVCPGRLEDVANPIQDFEDTQLIYPVLIAILFASNKTLAINNDLLYWREQIYAAFEDFPDNLAAAMGEDLTAAKGWDCQITTQPVTDLASWQQQNLDFSWLILNYTTTKTRGRS